jgi:hypothetical protein
LGKRQHGLNFANNILVRLIKLIFSNQIGEEAFVFAFPNPALLHLHAYREFFYPWRYQF